MSIWVALYLLLILGMGGACITHSEVIVILIGIGMGLVGIFAIVIQVGG